jgi:DNA-binding NarL/FixJ family response regulator
VDTAPEHIIRLGIVDASRLYVEAIAARLGAEPDIQVLRCGGDAPALRRMLDRSALDVVLGDVTLFDPAWLGPAGGARCGNGDGDDIGVPTVVLVAERSEFAALVPAVRAGVRGWVPRGATVEELLAAIRAAGGGGVWLPPRALTAVLDALVWSSPPEDPVETLLGMLTPREREVLLCLAEGLGRPAVAERLGMSTNTVRTHVQSILTKLDVSSSLAAVALVRGARPDTGRAATVAAPPLRLGELR